MCMGSYGFCHPVFLLWFYWAIAIWVPLNAQNPCKQKPSDAAAIGDRLWRNVSLSSGKYINTKSAHQKQEKSILLYFFLRQISIEIIQCSYSICARLIRAKRENDTVERNYSIGNGRVCVCVCLEWFETEWCVCAVLIWPKNELFKIWKLLLPPN